MATALVMTLALHSHACGWPLPDVRNHSRLRPGDLCEDDACDDGHHHAGLGGGHVAHAGRAWRRAGEVLSQSAARHAAGWRPIAKLSGVEEVTQDLGKNLLSWVTGCVFVYAALFWIGQFCFGRMTAGAVLGLAVGVAAVWHCIGLCPSPTEWRV